jgi:hypothetical protein
MTDFPPDVWERITQRLAQIVAELPDPDDRDPFWREEYQQPLRELGEEMLRHGMGLTEINYHFRRVFRAAKEFKEDTP